MAEATTAKTTMTIGDQAVWRMGYGAMRLTGPGIWGDSADREAAMKVLRKAVNLGVRFIDTADAYGPHTNEALIKDALHPYPPDLIIASKGGLVRSGPGNWERNASPKHLRAACEGSLSRLGVETIALYQLHAVDPDVPLADSLGALADLQREGKIKWIGVSNFDASQLRLAQSLVDVTSVQNRFNARDTNSRGLIDVCARDGIAFLPWHPFSAGKHVRDEKPDEDVQAIEAIAAAHGATVAQVILAWMLALSPNIVVIPGTGSLAHLEENVRAAEISLSDEEMRVISALEG